MAKFKAVEKDVNSNRIARDVVGLVRAELPWLLTNRPGVVNRYLDLPWSVRAGRPENWRHTALQKTRMHLARTAFWKDLHSGVFYDDDNRPFGFGNVFDNTTVRLPGGEEATLRRTDLWMLTGTSDENNRQAVELAARYKDYGGRVLAAMTDEAITHAIGVPHVMDFAKTVERVEVVGDDPYRLSEIPGPVHIFTLSALEQAQA